MAGHGAWACRWWAWWASRLLETFKKSPTAAYDGRHKASEFAEPVYKTRFGALFVSPTPVTFPFKKNCHTNTLTKSMGT